MRVWIDQDLCTGDGLCVDHCPDVFVQLEDRGSDPKPISVIKSQTTLVTLDAKPLGVSVRVVVEPATASLAVDGVPVGTGRWQGRLTVGAHTFVAREEGYHSATLAIESSGKSAAEQVIKLEVDRNHPRWAVAQKGSYLVEVSAGVGFGSSLGSDAEAGCTSCKGARGYIGSVRFGYELPNRVSFLIGLGYLHESRDVDRSIASSFSSPTGRVPVTYALHDELQLTGPLAVLGAGYGIPFGRFELGARLLLGVAAVSSRDAITGTARNSVSSAPIEVDRSGKSARGVAVLGLPEIFVGARFGSLSVRVGLSLIASIANGPRLDTGEMRIASGTCRPGAVECAPGTFAVANERAFGRFVMWVPELGVGVAF